MSLRETEPNDLDSRIKDIEVRLGIIAQPGAIGILLDFLPMLSEESVLRHMVYRILERLSALRHRNKVILCGLGILGRLFQTYTSQRSLSASGQERRIIQKLLRRILDLGATTVDTRIMFQAAVGPDRTLDADVLEMIRAGIKSRWPDHFSFEKRATLKFHEENTKGLPTSGFTFLVCARVNAAVNPAERFSALRFGFGSSDILLRKHKLFSPSACRRRHYFTSRSGSMVGWNYGVMVSRFLEL
jgi:hypothetical protein